jgi:hypothetical protein
MLPGGSGAITALAATVREATAGGEGQDPADCSVTEDYFSDTEA